MQDIYYLEYLIQHEGEYKEVSLKHKETLKVLTFSIDDKLMDFSLNNDIQIQNDPNIKILVYTSVDENNLPIYKMKAYYPSKAENLFETESLQFLIKNTI